MEYISNGFSTGNYKTKAKCGYEGTRNTREDVAKYEPNIEERSYRRFKDRTRRAIVGWILAKRANLEGDARIKEKSGGERVIDFTDTGDKEGNSSSFIQFMLKCILKSLQEIKKSNQKSNQKIISAMRQNSKVTINELQDITGLSESGVKKIIRKLKQDNIIERIGGTKGGYWIVNYKD